MEKKNFLMYSVYFQGPDYFEQIFLTDFEKSLECFNNMSESKSGDFHGDACEKVLLLIGLNDSSVIFSGTYGEINSENIIKQFDFE